MFQMNGVASAKVGGKKDIDSWMSRFVLVSLTQGQCTLEAQGMTQGRSEHMKAQG